MKPELKGHLACAAAYSIFGFNIVFCKDIATAGIISPIALFALRAVGATSLFWLISLFLPKEKVPLGDILKISLASFLGLFAPQFTFLSAIEVSTPMDTSILGSFVPVWTMFAAAIFLKEPITWKKVSGVIVSFGGALLLILNSISMGGGATSTQPAGVVYLILNGISFGLYLGIFRPLISKYSVITFMKWSFLWAFVISLPFALESILTADYALITPQLGGEIAFLIIFATCVAYFLIPYGQKHLRPTIISLYTYLQPLIACIISIALGMDVLTWQKMVGAAGVFAGVWLVNKSRAAGTS